MTLKKLYSLRILFRITRLMLAFFVLVDGVIVIIGLFELEFGRDLIIYATWIAFWVLLIILLSDAVRVVSEKIARIE